MKMPVNQQRAQRQVDALLVKVGLATEERNSGFQCFIGSGSRWPYGTEEQEFRVDFAAHRAVYEIVDSSSLPFLFTAVELDGEAEITRVVLSKRAPALEKVRSTRAFKQFIAKELPLPLAEIEPLLSKLAELADTRLAELELDVNLRNRIAMLNLWWAASSNRVMHREQMDFGEGPINYLRAGVDIEHILYAWSTDGWDYTRAQPALPLPDAAELQGVSLNRVRSLYPQVSGRS